MEVRGLVQTCRGKMLKRAPAYFVKSYATVFFFKQETLLHMQQCKSTLYSIFQSEITVEKECTVLRELKRMHLQRDQNHTQCPVLKITPTCLN